MNPHLGGSSSKMEGAGLYDGAKCLVVLADWTDTSKSEIRPVSYPVHKMTIKPENTGSRPSDGILDVSPRVTDSKWHDGKPRRPPSSLPARGVRQGRI